MTKQYKMIDLDCANCASKMEHAINKIGGVKHASVNFLTQKLTIDAPDENFESILQEVVKICKKIEPDCVIKI